MGNLYMSLIHTCELNGANPFDYLTELQRRAQQVKQAPADWMPWNYRERLAPGGIFTEPTEHAAREVVGKRRQFLPPSASCLPQSGFPNMPARKDCRRCREFRLCQG
jgi:hypothetical protein